MTNIHAIWKEHIAHSICRLVTPSARTSTIDPNSIVVNKTPDLCKGDLAFPMFPYAKLCAKSPQELATLVQADLEAKIQAKETLRNTRVIALGPYINIYLDRAQTSADLIGECLTALDNFGKSNILNQKRIMIEFSGPNTNKPLHLGHLRNDAIGESLARILARMGASVQKVNIINDRGVHICKSMLAYKKFGNGETPENVGLKSDHFVGLYYVRFAEWEAEYLARTASTQQQSQQAGETDLTTNATVRAMEQTDKTEYSPTEQIQAMLKLWEQGDPETLALWKLMNTWAIDGIFKSYENAGIYFDAVYYESETYGLGKDTVLQGLKEGVLAQEEDGTIVLSLEEINLDKKVLLRSDGTSVYITQDIGTAQMRYSDWAFDKMIYVVAHEQDYHFKVLFYALAKLGFQPAIDNKMHHLSYGMVSLPDGRMKSRQGTIVDADTLLNEMAQLVREGIVERNRAQEIEDIEEVSRNIAFGAIHYYLLSIQAKKDITFNPQSSLQFNGNTGPYLQYTCARIWTMLEKYPLPETEADWNSAVSDEEWQIITSIERFTATIEQVAEKYDPSILANYLYDLCVKYSSFYQNMPIANASQASLQAARINISKAVLQVLKNGLYLLNIPFVQKM